MLGQFTLVWLLGAVPLPGTSSVSTAMQPPSDCEPCHGGFEGSAHDTWSGSTMGHAARDPLFLAALDEAEKDLPGAGDFCLRCHAPEAWVMGRCAPTDGSRLLPTDSGVTCSTCHRMKPSPWQRNGQYTLAEDLRYRGPYSDAEAPHAWAQSDFISDSRLCGACHDLRNPLVNRLDLDGRDTGQPFPEQLTYTEWATSDFARGDDLQSCQSCHMPESSGLVGRRGPTRPDRSSHALTGGNLFLKAAIAYLYPELGLAASLAEGEAEARALMRSAATLELVDGPGTVDRGAVLPLTFRITNLAGHKLPTGYPEGRRMWLEVISTALDIDRGRFDPESGEPVDPARVWRAEHGQRTTGVGHRLILNDTIFFDNRIPPRGLVVTATTAPVGVTYPEVSPGVLAHWDDVVVTATVACDASGAPLRVDARLWYQSVTKRYVDSLVEEGASSARAEALQFAFEDADPGPVELVGLSIDLPVREASSCATPDAGSLDAGGADAAAGVDASLEDSSAGEASSGTGQGSGAGCTCAAPRTDADGLLSLTLILLFIGPGRFRSRRRRCR